MTPDWRQLILDLRRHGMTTRAAAARLGISETTLYSYVQRNACEPPYSFGVRMLTLHRSVTGKEPPMYGEAV